MTERGNRADPREGAMSEAYDAMERSGAVKFNIERELSRLRSELEAVKKEKDEAVKLLRAMSAAVTMPSSLAARVGQFLARTGG
jgi:hypothetical protein